MAVKKEYKELKFEVKQDSITDDGKFEGYASVFGVVDLGYDVAMRGMFAKSLTTRTPKLLWQHNMGQPIGVWEELKEDERGLFVKGRLLGKVQQGAEAMELLRAGAIDSMSIGYSTVHADYTDDGLRKLMEVDLHEISLVTFAMLPDAMVTDVKSIKTEREFEAFLRDSGYSRKEAAAIALHGYKAVSDQRDAVKDVQRDAEAKKKQEQEELKSLLASLSTTRERFNGTGN